MGVAPALLAACCGCAIAGQDYRGAAEPTTEATAAPARRAVRVFDFEEPTNPEAIPAGWIRAQSAREGGGEAQAVGGGGAAGRAGFPEYNRAEFDFGVARSGTTSVKLPTRGGGVSLRLRPGELPVFPDADYVVTGWVKPDRLMHAQAFLVARLLDQRLVPIPGSEMRSEGAGGGGGSDGWKQVSVALPSASRDAAWLQIDLEVLQPKQFLPPKSGASAQHAVWREDVDAAAWFDDVSVYQVPRARLWTTVDGNLFEPGQKPLLWMMVRDLAGKPLRGRVSVVDASGTVVDSEERTLDPGARAASWSPRLNAFGWYRAMLEIRSEDAAVSRAEVAFAYLAPWRLGQSAPGAHGSAGDRSRFGVAAENTPERALGGLTEVIREVGTGFVVIPAIDASLPASEATNVMRRRGRLYDDLLGLGQRVTLCVNRVPDDLIGALVLDVDDAIGMCEQPSSYWYPYMGPTLDVYGQRFVRYQLGGVGDVHAARRALNQSFSAFEAALSGLVPNPMVALSWRAEQSPPSVARVAVKDPKFAGIKPVGSLVDGVTLSVPSSFSSGSMGETLKPWLGTRIEPGGEGAPELTVVLDLPEAKWFGDDAPVIELARRAVEAWAVIGGKDAGIAPARLGIRAPWHPLTSATLDPRSSLSLSPDPQLVCWRTLIDQLAGRRVVSTLPAPPGVKAYVLAAGVGRAGGLDDGCVIAWNESAPSQTVLIDVAPAGAKVTMTDVFGNRAALDPPPASADGVPAPLLRVPVGESPVFIEGVDPYLAMFAASFRVDPSYIPAVVTEHEHTISLSNPWPIRITGKLQLRDAEDAGAFARHGRSEDWSITPRGIIDFAIEPGESVRLPITITLGSAQVAGVRDFSIVARVSADRQYPAIRLKTPVEIGLRSIQLTPEVRLSPTPDGPDVVVTATVTNTDSRPRVLRLEAAASQQTTQQQQISNLAPGESTVRRFVFRDAVKVLSGRRVFVTLTEAEGAERLNKAVVVP